MEIWFSFHQKNYAHEGTQIKPVTLKNAEMNGVKVNIVTQIILLVIKSFDARLHLQKHMKRKLMIKYAFTEKLLP